MISMYMIIAALLPPALTKGFMECHLCGPTGTLQCFGALKEPLIFHLPKKVTKTMLKNNKNLTILNIVNGTGILPEEYKSHAAYFSNGTFKLNNARWTDAGNYQLQTYGSDGKLLHDIDMHLEIQASVSKPAVSQVCSSPDLMNVSCSSEGDAVEFTLTLDGHFLLQTEGRSPSQSSGTINHQTEDRCGVSSVTISLYGQLTGHLVCHVGNNVSRDETVVRLTSCEEVSSFPVVTVAVTAGVVSLLLLVLLCLWIKHVRNQPRPTTVDEGNGEVEIIYSDVRVTRKPRA